MARQFGADVVFDEPIVTDGGVALGGHHTLVVSRDGTYRYKGSFRATGLPSYDVAIVTIEAGLGRGAVFVHCWGGVGRTATVIGCVLADEGLGYDEIIDRLATLRRGSRKANRSALEMPVQHDLLRWRAAARGR